MGRGQERGWLPGIFQVIGGIELAERFLMMISQATAALT